MSAITVRRMLLTAFVLSALSAVILGIPKPATKKPSTPKWTTTSRPGITSTQKPGTISTQKPVVNILEKPPGIIQTVDEKYLSMVHRELLLGDVLRQKLDNSTIPDLVGYVKLNFGSILEFRISNITVIRHEQPTIKVTLPSTTMKLEVNVPEISLEGNYDFTNIQELFGSIKSRGHFQLDIIGVAMTMDRKLVILQENNETVRIESENSRINITDVNYDFHDAQANTFVGNMDPRELRQLIADALRNASRFLTDLVLKFSQDRSKDIYLNMDLLRTFVQDKHLILHHRGEMLGKGTWSTYKDWPEPLSSSNATSMVQYDISTFTFKTFSNVLHKQRILNFSYKKSDLPSEQKDLLNINCDGQCFGKLFPSATNKFSGKTVEIDLSTSQTPVITLSKDDLKITFLFKVVAYAKVSEYKRDPLFTSTIKMTHKVDLNIKTGRISIDLQQDGTPEVKIVDSKIGELHEENVLMVAHLPLMKRFPVLIELLKYHLIRLSAPPSLRIIESDWKRLTDSIRIKIDYEHKMK